MNNQEILSIASKEADREVIKDYKQLIVPIIFFILKEFSSKEHPLTVKQIVDLSANTTHVPFADLGTFMRILTRLARILDSSQEVMDDYGKELQASICAAFGGRLKMLEDKSDKDKGKSRYRFYFEPLLSASDLTMLSNSIASNIFLTPEEKDYLIASERTLGNCSVGKDITLSDIQDNAIRDTSYFNRICDELIPKAKEKKRSNSDVKITHKMLDYIGILHRAIEQGIMVRMTYARYEPRNKSGKNSEIVMTPVHNNKEYILNPYALLWNRGHIYLVATLQGDEEQPRHYRVDRIYTLELVKNPDFNPADYIFTKGQTDKNPKFLPVHKCPEVLAQYFKKSGARKVFDPQKYTAEHPLMGIAPLRRPAEASASSDLSKVSISHLSDMISRCELECSEKALPILIDTFGTNISIRPSELNSHHSGTFSSGGDNMKYYIATIDKVNSSCMELYCIEHAHRFNVISPLELRKKVITALKERLEDMQTLN